MSTHLLATGHPPPQGFCNPIFWALILLHRLKASQTETYNTIIDNALHHPSSSLPHPRLHPLIILVGPRGARFPRSCQAISKPVKSRSLKCPFDIKGTCWETERRGCNVAFDEEDVRSRYNGAEGMSEAASEITFKDRRSVAASLSPAVGGEVEILEKKKKKTRRGEGRVRERGSAVNVRSGRGMPSGQDRYGIDASGLDMWEHAP